MKPLLLIVVLFVVCSISKAQECCVPFRTFSANFESDAFNGQAGQESATFKGMFYYDGVGSRIAQRYEATVKDGPRAGQVEQDTEIIDFAKKKVYLINESPTNTCIVGAVSSELPASCYGATYRWYPTGSVVLSMSYKVILFANSYNASGQIINTTDVVALNDGCVPIYSSTTVTRGGHQQTITHARFFNFKSGFDSTVFNIPPTCRQTLENKREILSSKTKPFSLLLPYLE